MAVLNMPIPDDLHDRVRAAATEQDRTVKAVVIRALEAEVSRWERSQARRRRQADQ